MPPKFKGVNKKELVPEINKIARKILQIEDSQIKNTENKRS